MTPEERIDRIERALDRHIEFVGQEIEKNTAGIRDARHAFACLFEHTGNGHRSAQSVFFIGNRLRLDAEQFADNGRKDGEGPRLVRWQL